MPVTTRGAPVEVKLAPQLRTFNSTSLLQSTCSALWKPGNAVLDSSFGDETPMQASNNGFVSTVLDAYLQHNHLVLRPEDIWFAILIQFSFYVNKHSEKMRKYFVNHAGKKKLEILQDSMDLPAFVLEMTELIAKNVKDPDLREWIMPSFSTTTDGDRVSAAIIMMGTMQKYFAYFLGITCGIPSVTLLGEKKDWEDILERIQFLTKFGLEHEELLIWNSVLTAVTSSFVKTFDAPDSPDVVKFWQRSVHQYSDNYSGEKLITGWLLAFCFWDVDGKPLVVNGLQRTTEDWRHSVKEHGPEYWLDGVRLGSMKWNDVPAGYAHVPIHLKIYDTGEKYMLKAIAGSVGWKVLDSDTIFAQTRGENAEKLKKGERAKPQKPLLQSIKKKNVAEPSTYTDSTLVENKQMRKPGILQQIAQEIFCFRSANDKEDEIFPPKTKAADDEATTSDKTPAETNEPWTEDVQPANDHYSSYFAEYIFDEVSENAPQISDLSELQMPWKYEAGGKNDTIQPVTGWWVMKTIEGEYGKDPDVPDVEFDSDEEGYDDDLARNGRPFNLEL